MKKRMTALCALCLAAVLMISACSKDPGKPYASSNETSSSAQNSENTEPVGDTDSSEYGGDVSSEDTMPIDRPTAGETNSSDVASVYFGDSLKQTNMTAKTMNGAELSTGRALGKEYWQLMSVEAEDSLLFTLEDSFLKKIGKKDIVFIIEYYANSSKQFDFSYTNGSKIHNQQYDLGALNNWTGKNIRISDFTSGNGLEGSHFKLKLASGLQQMRVASVKVVIVEKETSNYPQIIKTKYDTNAHIIAEENVRHYGAVGDGENDDTYAIHTAIAQVKSKGGGIAFIPAGTYKITQTIIVPEGVTLYGDFSAPDGKGIKGTMLKIYTDTEASGNHTSAIQMRAGSSLKGMTIWYPEQVLKDGKAIAYPYTIEMMEQQGITLEHLYLVNSYKGIKMGSNTNALQTLRHIYGTTLKVGLYQDQTVDVARFEDINFSVDWWLTSGLAGTPKKDALSKWMLGNSIALHIEGVDWTYASDITVNGYKIGIYLSKSENGMMSNGHLYRMNITNCNVCIFAEYTNYYGYEITDSVLSASGGNNPVAIRCADTFVNSITCLSTKLSSTGIYVVENRGSGSIALQNSSMSLSASGAKYGIHSEKGRFSAIGVSFSGNGKFAYCGQKNKQANIVNCMSADTIKVDNAGEASALSITYDSADKATALPVPETPYVQRVTKPAAVKFFNAADYGVKPGTTDSSAGLQKAIDAAATAGGGSVYVPYGIYRLDKAITVKTGVELVGSFDNPHHTKVAATVFFTDFGKNDANGTALINLQQKSGIRGFTVFYDKQTTDAIVPYSYTIRGNGSNIYIVNVTLSFTYQGIDLMKNRCDNHYVEAVGFGALKMGIAVGGGSSNGVVRDVQANIHYISDNWFEGGTRVTQSIYDYTFANLQGFLVSDTKAETMLNNFIFGALHGIAIVDKADAYIIGHGTDSGIKGVYINGTGEKAVNFVNTQLVNIGTTEKNYILADTKFAGTVNFFNVNVWGQPTDAVVVKNGTINLISGTFFECGGAAVVLRGGKVNASGLFISRRTTADYIIEQGAKEFRAFGNLYNSTKRIVNNSDLTLKGNDCK